MAPPVASKTPSYTPYRHTSELAMVRDWFFPHRTTPDPYSPPPADMRQPAVHRVQMWSFKDPKLAHAIIATANLTDAMLHDTLDRRRAISDWGLRSIYAMAFCRFVNGFVDRDIAKAALKANAAPAAAGAGSDDHGGDGATTPTPTTTSRGESSMYAHALAIGLPERFVDLRHQATHDEMPSLEVLRQMARRGLDWLWERWWKVNATDDPGRALREREERRLLGQVKAQTRRDTEPVDEEAEGVVGTVNISAKRSSRADYCMNESGTVSGSDRVDQQCVSCRKRKRHRQLGYGTDEEEGWTERRRDVEKVKRRVPVKAARQLLKPAFGLFEQ